MTIETKQQHGIKLIKEFLLENQQYLLNNQSDLMRGSYINFCHKLERLMPINVTSPIPENLNKPVIIAANHLHTPWLFQIKDSQFLSQLNLNLNDFWFGTYLPTIVRHYPIVNLTTTMGLFPQVVSGQQPKILNEFAHHWHQVIVPPPEQPNKTQYLIQQIDQLTHPKYGLIIFPEGRDTGGYLHEYHYFMHPFRTGTAVFAHKLNLPILPVSLAFDIESYEYFVHVDELITIDTTNNLTTKDLTSLIQTKVIDGIKSALPKVRVTIIQEQ